MHCVCCKLLLSHVDPRLGQVHKYGRMVAGKKRRSNKSLQLHLSTPILHLERSNMRHQQVFQLLGLVLLVWQPAGCSSVVGRCALDQATSPLCVSQLEEYFAHVTNMPNHLNERSLAAWTYVKNIDLDRVPQVIHEASCLTSHSCSGVDTSSSVESVPLVFRMPVLRRNPGCPFHTVEFENINIACICATSRQN